MTVHKILVGSYTKEITTLLFDPEVPSLTVASKATTGQSPSWISRHPTNSSLIFATNEVTDGKIQLFQVSDEDGSLTFLEETSSGGADPAHLAVTDDAVFVANYSGGSLRIIPLSNTSPYLQPPTQELIKFEGSGPNSERQEASHPHQVVIHPSREEVLVPDLGADKVWRLLKDDSGTWSVQGSLDVASGAGPRHAVVHQSVLYTGLELSNTVVSHTLPPLPEEPKSLDSHVTAPHHAQPYDPSMLLGEVLISPSTPAYPSSLIYASNRNEPTTTSVHSQTVSGDSIAVFIPHHASSISQLVNPESGKSTSSFRRLGNITTGLSHLRAVALGGPGSKYLIVGGLNGGGIKIFERVGGSAREIVWLKEEEAVEKPTAFIWL